MIAILTSSSIAAMPIPVRPLQDDAAAFHRYVYLRPNPDGPLREYWYHASGCRNWLIVARDTRTHEISGAILAQEHSSEPEAAYPAAREVGR